MSTTQQSRIDPSATSSRDDTSSASRAESAHATGPGAKKAWWQNKILLMSVLGGGGALLLLSAVAMSVGDFQSTDQQLIFYTVKQSSLPITVTERGNLDSQEKVEIFCELENLSYDRSGSSGTQILYIVPNGASVKANDLLVEFDAAALQERLDAQVLALERAKAEQIQADAKYENQITQNQTSLAEAELDVELADLDLKSYEDDDGGTFQLELQDVEMKIQEAQAGKLIEDQDLEGVEELYKLGYKSQGDLAQARLSAMKADRSVALAVSERKKKTFYDYRMQRLQLQGKLDTARRNQQQVGRDNESLLAQALASKNAADRALEKEQEKFDKYTEQLEKCKIFAPQDGMVAYAMEESMRRSSSSVIAEGAFVRERQKILTLPSLKMMEVKTAVHESVLDQVTMGLPATVRLDAFVDRTYKGSVKSVAVMPDPGGFLSSGAKVYSTVVVIDEEVDGLKPGMTAVVEIHVDMLKDVLSIPVQAVVQVRRANWCYVDTGRGVERRTLSLGKTNDKFVQILDGLADGDRVVLNPMAIVDESRDEEEAEEGDDGEASEDGEGDGESSSGDDAEAGGRGPDGQQRPGGGQGPGAGQRGQGAGQRGQGGGGMNLSSFDKDGDGKVSREEAPEQMQPFFDRLDANGDGVIDASEIPQRREGGARGGQGGPGQAQGQGERRRPEGGGGRAGGGGMRGQGGGGGGRGLQGGGRGGGGAGGGGAGGGGARGEGGR